MTTKHEADVVKLRDRINILKRKIDAAEQMLVPLEIACGRSDDMVDDLAEQGAFSGEEFATKEYSRPRFHNSDDVLRFIAWIGADEIKNRMRAVISDFYKDYRGTFDTKETQSQMQADCEALFQLEVAEERLIVTAEAEGLHINRRADADPRAVLAA